MTAAELLDLLDQTLVRIQELLPSSEQAWLDDEVKRLAVERLWITAGNVAEAYRRVTDHAERVEPWSRLYTYRNWLAHVLPPDHSPLRAYRESSSALPGLLQQVRALRA